VSDDSATWFEGRYADAASTDDLPWADLVPNPLLLPWLDARGEAGEGRTALVVGCGLGDDAEELARRGYAVTAFDAAPSAVAWARRRFPESSVEYLVADATALPSAWHGAFALAVEAYTLQAVLAEERPLVAREVAAALAPGGVLLAIATARRAGDPPSTSRPYPLTPAELRAFFPSLVEEALDEVVEDDGGRHLRGTFRRPDDR
jgi:ubiquinone/menaquinone biosynthesis C-methylase UbiE